MGATTSTESRANASAKGCPRLKSCPTSAVLEVILPANGSEKRVRERSSAAMSARARAAASWARACSICGTFATSGGTLSPGFRMA